MYVIHASTLMGVLITTSKDMGLGKTLSMLALICCSLDSDTSIEGQNQNTQHKGTLIVAPKSSMFNAERHDIWGSLTTWEGIYGWETQVSE